MENPSLGLHDGNGTLIAVNDDWSSDINAGAVQAVGLAPLEPRESAAYRTLSGGNYTAIVRGKHDRTGVGLVEIYNVP